MTPLEQAHYLTEMVQQGYYSIRVMPNQTHWVGLHDFMFTTAIIVGEMGDYINIHDRWCYHTREAAQAALDAWNADPAATFTGEPEGWHRHPFSGRRRVKLETKRW